MGLLLSFCARLLLLRLGGADASACPLVFVLVLLPIGAGDE